MPEITPEPRARWRGRRWPRLAAAGLAGAFGLALAGPAGALLPIADDGGGYQPGSGYGTEYDTGTEYTPPSEPTAQDGPATAPAPGGGDLAVPDAPPSDQAGQAPAANPATKTPETLSQETKDAVPVIIGEDGTVIEGGEVGPYPDPAEPTDPSYGGGGGGGDGDYWYDDLYWIEAEEYAY